MPFNPGDSVKGYKIQKLINTGNFCDSYIASKEGKDYFFKYYLNFESDRELRAFKKNQDDISILLKSYPYSEKTLETQITEKNVYQVKTLINGTDLDKTIEGNKSFRFIMDCMVKLANNVNEVNKRGIIHFDLKPQQFLVEKSSKELLIVDFDWSFQPGRHLRLVGTPLYKSPEHYLGENISYSSDVFSTGIILYEYLSGGGHPYLNDGEIFDEEQLKRALRTRKPGPPIHTFIDFMPKELSETIINMVDPMPFNRPPMTQAIKALEEARDIIFYPVPVSFVLREEKSRDFMISDTECLFDRDLVKKYFGHILDSEEEPIYYYWNSDRTPMFRIYLEAAKGWFIEDVLGTHNWVQHNGKKLCGKTLLKNGDRISLIYRKTGNEVAGFKIEL